MSKIPDMKKYENKIGINEAIYNQRILDLCH